MKKRRTGLFLMLALIVMVGISTIYPMDTMAATSKTATTSNKKKTVKKGWVTNKWGKKYYKKGVPLTGLQKINKKYYFFGKKGYLQIGTKTFGKYTYYTDTKGVLEGYKKGSKYYTPNGKKLSKVKAEDFKTYQTAKNILNTQILRSKSERNASKSYKLKKAFDWVMAKYYQTWRPFTNQSGWPALYANDHFQNRNGNCFSDAAAFAYLAKAIGCKEVYVCVDSKGGNGHAWTLVDGLYYDPLFAQSKSYSGYYGTRGYPLTALTKEKV